MNITLSSVSSAITCNSELYQKEAPIEVLGQIALGAESAGVSNTRLNLKNSAILIPGDSWKEDFTLGDGQEGMVADLDWARFEGTANSNQWRELVMMLFPGRDENFWINKDAKIKNYPSDPGYPNCLAGEFGTKLGWRKEENIYHWALTLPGTALKAMCTVGWGRLLLKLDDLISDLNPTRLDFFLEDYARRLDPINIQDALSRHNYSGFRKKEMHYSDSDGDGWDGMTFKFGSRESDSYWRAYHTRAKHDYDGMRLERELKGDKAKAAWKLLKAKLRENEGAMRGYDHSKRQQAEWNIAAFAAAMAVEGLEFIDRSQQYDNGSLENCPRLDWWEAIKGVCGEVKLQTRKVVRSLEKTHKWLERQVSKALRKLHDGLGQPEFLSYVETLVTGVKNLDPKDKMDIAVLRARGAQALGDNVIKSAFGLKSYQQEMDNWAKFLNGMGMPTRYPDDSRFARGI